LCVFRGELAALVRQGAVHAIVARGALAGCLAYLVWKKLAIAFVVESFEPHADYMLESAVWQRYDPRFLFERHWENRQKRVAAGLMNVAENHRQQLLAEGVPAARVVTVPCSVNLAAFRFSAPVRQVQRK